MYWSSSQGKKSKHENSRRKTYSVKNKRERERHFSCREALTKSYFTSTFRGRSDRSKRSSEVNSGEEKPRKSKTKVGLVSFDCAGFQGPRDGRIIEKQELTKILIDIRRQVARPQSEAKVNRELGDPMLFVVPQDENPPLSSRTEFKGADKPWQEVNVLTRPIKAWEEKLFKKQDKTKLGEAGSEEGIPMSQRPQFQGSATGWQQMVVVAKPIKEWEEKLEENSRRQVEMVVVVEPIKEWEDKVVHNYVGHELVSFEEFETRRFHSMSRRFRDRKRRRRA